MFCHLATWQWDQKNTQAIERGSCISSKVENKKHKIAREKHKIEKNSLLDSTVESPRVTAPTAGARFHRAPLPIWMQQSPLGLTHGRNLFPTWAWNVPSGPQAGSSCHTDKNRMDGCWLKFTYILYYMIFMICYMYCRSHLSHLSGSCKIGLG